VEGVRFDGLMTGDINDDDGGLVTTALVESQKPASFS